MSKLLSYRRLKSLYSSSPQWMQRAYASIPFHWRAGRAYRDTRRLIAETDELDWDSLRAGQLGRLRELLLHAQDHVPFYQQLRESSGIRVPGDPQSVAEYFEQLPLIAKTDIQQEPGRFQASGGVAEPVYADNTGGSSGTPFEFLKNNRMYPIEQAYMMAQWERIGYRPGDRKLTLRGRTFSGRAAGDRWAVNPIYNELVLSSYHLDPDTIAESLKVVHRFRPRYIHGYPSAIVTFLRGVHEAGLEMPRGIRAVLCGSEPTYGYQREFIKDVLGCRAYSWYGQSECVLLAGECDQSQDYHSFPLYGVLEIIDDEGRPINEAGVEGEIVGTSLNNFAMPFIRYRTGDRGIYASRETCVCGRSYPRLQRVTGRKQQFIYTSQRTAVPVTAFVFGQHFDAFRRICALQLVQDEPGELRMRIVRGAGFAESDERELTSRMQQSVDDALRVHIEYAEQLPVNQAGKTDFVIQNVKEERCSENV